MSVKWRVIRGNRKRDLRDDRRRPGLRRAALFAFALITYHLSLITAVQAQQEVRLSSVTQTIFTNAACAVSNVNINNRGQGVHFLIYQTSGTINSISIRFEGRNDATLTWQPISATATNTTSSGLWARAYLNFVRVSITACSGTGTISATYTGDFIGADPSFGFFGGGGSPPFGVCDNQVAVQFTAAAAGSTRIITNTGAGRIVYLCHLSITLTAAQNVIIERATGGATCPTGNTDLTGAYSNVTSLVLDLGAWSPLRGTAANDICINVGGATTVGGLAIYAEF